MTKKIVAGVKGRLHVGGSESASADGYVPTARVPVEPVPKNERKAFRRAAERARVKELSEIVASLENNTVPNRHFLPNGQPLLRRIRNVGRTGTVTIKRRLPPWGSDWRSKHLERNGNGWLFKNGSEPKDQGAVRAAKTLCTTKGKGRKRQSSLQKALRDYRRSMKRKEANFSVACYHFYRAIALSKTPDQIQDLCEELSRCLEVPQLLVRDLINRLHSRILVLICRVATFDKAQEWFRAICDEAVPIDKQSIFMHVVQLADSAKQLRCVYDRAKSRKYTECVSLALRKMSDFAAQRSLRGKANNEDEQEMIERELAILFG